MKPLYLQDLKDLTEAELRQHIITEYEAKPEDLTPYEILIAYESVGSWGCDSSSFFLLRNKKTKKLYEVHGSHCSCYGFEGQWKPEETSMEYLESDKFYFSCGGYDDDDKIHRYQVKEYILKLREGTSPCMTTAT